MSTNFLFLIFNVLKFTTQTHDFFAYHFPKNYTYIKYYQNPYQDISNDIINMKLMIGH